MMSETIWRSIEDFKRRKLSLVWQEIVHLDPLSVKSFSWVISKFEMSLSEYLKTRLEYAAMPMQFQAPGSAVAQFDSWDFNLKTATIFSLFDKSAFTPAPRFKLNLGYPPFKCEMVAANILKSRSFPLWQLRLPERGWRHSWNLKNSFCLSTPNWRPDLSARHFFRWNPTSPEQRLFVALQHLPNMCVCLIWLWQLAHNTYFWFIKP